jgi:ABC-type transport system involved in multi-copper enzyme maturation permease subunit
VTLLLRLTFRSLRNGLAGLIAMLAGIILFEFAQPLVIASFGGASGLDAIMTRLPPALQVLARARPEFLAMSGLMGYLSLGYTHPLYLVLTCAAVVAYPARALAGEMERGFVKMALSRSISRTRYFMSRLLGVVVIGLLLAFSGPLGTILGIAIAGIEADFELARIPLLMATTLALLWAVAGIALCASALASSSGQATGWLLAILLVSFFVDYFSSIWRPLQSIAGVSIYHYYDPTGALATGQMEQRNVVVLGLVGLVASLAGLLVFQRRDLPS